jgi:hypothetical protein
MEARCTRAWCAVTPQSFPLLWVSNETSWHGWMNTDNEGVNPIATVTALSERSLALLAEKYAFSINLETRNGNLDVNSVPRVSKPLHPHPDKATTITKGAKNIGWQFTEVLGGYIDINSGSEDFAVCESRGKSSSCAMLAYLTVEIFCNSKGRRPLILLQGFETYFASTYSDPTI